mgnify:CR=1 FL=1
MKEYDSLSDNEKRNMLASVANLYYNVEMTQNQIAERFFTSRSKISRMLKEARQLGIVEIKILEPWDRNVELEQEFMRRFALKDVRVISVKEANNTMVLQKLGEVAAYYLDNLLNDNGVSLLHCITGIVGGNNTWIDKYIFPGGYIPGIAELVGYMSERNFDVIDVENLRLHYGRTLEHWAENFENALPEIRKTKDETFIRMWRLYLNSCAASFNCGNINIHQFLFNKGVNNDLQWTRDYMYK